MGPKKNRASLGRTLNGRRRSGDDAPWYQSQPLIDMCRYGSTFESYRISLEVERDRFLQRSSVALGSHSSIILPPIAVEMSPIGGIVTEESRSAASVSLLVSTSAKYLNQIHKK